MVEVAFTYLRTVVLVWVKQKFFFYTFCPMRTFAVGNRVWRNIYYFSIIRDKTGRPSGRHFFFVHSHLQTKFFFLIFLYMLFIRTLRVRSLILCVASRKKKIKINHVRSVVVVKRRMGYLYGRSRRLRLTSTGGGGVNRWESRRIHHLRCAQIARNGRPSKSSQH